MRNLRLQGNKERKEKTGRKKCEAQKKQRLDLGKKLVEQLSHTALSFAFSISVMIPLNFIVIFAKNMSHLYEVCVIIQFACSGCAC